MQALVFPSSWYVCMHMPMRRDRPAFPQETRERAPNRLGTHQLGELRYFVINPVAWVLSSLVKTRAMLVNRSMDSRWQVVYRESQDALGDESSHSVVREQPQLLGIWLHHRS